MELRRPRKEDKSTILEMIAEFQESGSATDGFFGAENFVYEDWLEDNHKAELGLGLPDGFVPAIQMVAFAEDGRALGFLNLRLRLSDYLFVHGGHIGYSIRPSERRRGYARESLRQGLLLARQKNIQRVLVTCSVDNEASRRTILSNSGIYEDTIEGTERYWIG